MGITDICDNNEISREALHIDTLPNPEKYALTYRPHTISPSGKHRDLNGIGRGGGKVS